MARQARLAILFLLITATTMATEQPSLAEGQITVAHTLTDPRDAINEWFPRHGISPSAGICVAGRESGLDRFNDTSKYFGLFQHLRSAWNDRVAAYNRANDLRTPNNNPHDPTTQALVTAWMVKNDGNWGQWNNTGRACGLKVSRSRPRHR